MKITINTKDMAVMKAISSLLDGIIATAVMNHPDGEFNDELLAYTMDLGEPKQRKGHDAPKVDQSRVKYQAVLPTLRKDATKVIEQNLTNLRPGTQHATVYRHVVNQTMEGNSVTKKEVMAACRIPVASSAERVLGDLVKQGILASIPIVHSAAE